MSIYGPDNYRCSTCGVYVDELAGCLCAPNTKAEREAFEKRMDEKFPSRRIGRMEDSDGG